MIPAHALNRRKTPVQARSANTVAAISEAAIQVLLAHGRERLTTTRVAERAGVSVGTLYQYFPNKQSLLAAVLQEHLGKVMKATQRACAEHHEQPLATMVEAVVQAFVDAKLQRPDVSVALYAVAPDLQGAALSQRLRKGGLAAIASMLTTAPDARFDDVQAVASIVYFAMIGVVRGTLESGAPPRFVRGVKKELATLCLSYLMAAKVCDH